MHSVADRFYPSQNSISEVMHSYALYVHLGHRPDDFYYISFYWFLFPVHQMIFRHAFLKHNIPLHVIYTLSFYKCLRTTYYNANLPYLDAGNVNVGWSHVLWDKRRKKCNSSCGALLTRAICHNCSEFLLCRGRSFQKAFLGVKWENPFFFFLFFSLFFFLVTLKDAASFLFGVIRLLRTSSSSRRFADSS